jgi:subtilisin family serine protease
VAVLLSLGKEDEDRRRFFYDSTHLADAVDYLVGVAEAMKRPISINVSLGTNGAAHDGSSAINRWIDSALTVPGRSVCVAAGNAGQEAPENEKDFGYMLGRIHTSGRIAASGLATDLDWLVVGSGLYDISENELEIWYSPADRFAVSVRPPGMDWTEPIEPGEYIENRQLPDGSFFSLYNEFYHPANGASFIGIYLSPYFSPTAVKGVRAGTWRVRLFGREVRDGRYDGWIERDDPVRLGGTGEFWAFPSFFAEASNVDRSSVSSLACGQNVIAVANLHDRLERINISSSQGPTRDGRYKPEIAAPGTDIVAAAGFSDPPGTGWIEMTGTSMASPYVAGVVGLMLAKRPTLTAAQILGIIQRTASPLPGSDFTWRTDAGYGRLNPAACLAEIDLFEARRDRT